MQAMPRPESNTFDLAERVRALAPMLADLDPRVRKSAVIALGRMGCPEATRELCARLNDADEGVRVLACQALGRVADSASVPALLSCVHDGSAEVRAGVLWALANVVAHGSLTTEEREALFSPIVVMAFDPNDGVRADAAAVLGTLRDARATDALTVLLEDTHPRVRANACASLGLLDDEAGLDALLVVAETPSEDPLVLVSALDGLGRRAERGGLAFDGQRAERAVLATCALAEMAGNAEPPTSAAAPSAQEQSSAADVRATAIWALGLLAPLAPIQRKRVQEVLRSALESSDVWAQRYGIEALARIHDNEAQTALESWGRAAQKRLENNGASPLADAQTARVWEQALATFVLADEP